MIFGESFLMTGVRLDWMTPELSAWITGILSLMILSFLYKENPFYRFAEHVYVGTSAAHSLIATWHNTLRPAIDNSMKVEGQWWLILPMALGLLIYFNMYRPLSWLARMPMAYWIGYNAGMYFSIREIQPWMASILATMRPLIAMPGGSFNLGGTLSNIILIASVSCVLIYFFFTIEHTGVFSYAAQYGRYAIMLGLGASFGNTVAARVSLLIGRWEFIFGTWLGLLK